MRLVRIFFKLILKESSKSLDPDWSHRSLVFHAPPSATRPFTISTLQISSQSPPFDLTYAIDPSPLSVSSASSMSLVLELFIKLGLRMVIVTEDGEYRGAIHKKRLLSFVSTLKRRPL